MTLGNLCLIVAALMALTGMSMGIYMGIGQDFTLAPAHAHLNLLGWVTMAIYGLYHRGSGVPATVMRCLQALAGGLGAPAMAGGLAVLLTAPAGSDLAGAGETAIMVGSVLAMLGMLLFVFIVARDLARSLVRRSERARWGMPEADPVGG